VVIADGYDVRPLTADDAPALAAAYRRNREHLAPWDPVHPEDFFTEEGQEALVDAQLARADQDLMDAWVLWYGEQVVGRINLNNIIRGVLQSASLGYWVDHEHVGAGLASGLVRHATARADEIGLHRLEAGTLVHNIASQRVLEHCGFELYGTAPQFLYIAGAWQDHHLYQRIINDHPAGAPVA
jgi:[ribosomal protein S5]-alanine N-acetyltransferase